MGFAESCGISRMGGEKMAVNLQGQIKLLLLLLLTNLFSVDLTITFTKQCNANSRQQAYVNFLMPGGNNSLQPRRQEILFCLISVDVSSADNVGRPLIANIDGQRQMLIHVRKKKFV